jgi:hypothetical protein
MITNRSLTTKENYRKIGLNFIISLALTILRNIDRCVLVSLIDIIDDLLYAFWNIIEVNECCLEG